MHRTFLNINTKNDSGLVIRANDFPSAHTKYVEDTIGEDGIIKLMEGIEDREAYFLSLAYTEYGGEPVTFISKTEGTISKENKENMVGVMTKYSFLKVKRKH